MTAPAVPHPATTMYLAAIALVAQGFLWSQSRYADVKHPRPSSSVAGVSSVLLAPVGAPQHAADTAQARFANISFVGSDLYTLEASCEPLRRPVAHQCAHVRAECDPPETFLSISYLESYFCSPTAVRPFTFAGLVLWLFFLFSFIGICASDFFCPNLATIADTLGLNENVAGVTFLAFGNGSPDLFSTFSAMRAGSGSLAIGELLGAASFIVSVVAGSMPLVRPFRVNPRSFVRDVGFFTVAVACILAILIDGEIHAWEAMAMVGLYLVYVTVVIGGSWWENRQDRLAKHEALIRGEYSDTPVEPDRNGNAFEPYRDDVSEPHRSLPTPSIRGRAHSNPSVPADQMLIPSGPHIASRPHLHIPGPSSRSRASSVSQSSPLTTSRSPSHVHQLPSFSLLGALEFRTVVNSLHGASTAETLSIFDAPVSPYVAGHYTRRLSAGRMSPAGSIYRMPVATAPPALDASRSDAERDPWDAAFSLQLNERNALTPTPAGEHNRAKSPVPSINVFSPSSPNGTSAAAPRKLFVPDDAPAPARWRTGLSELGHTLFPSLMGISARPWLWKIIAICSAPAIFALTLTLPVVVNESEAEDNPVRPVGTPAIEAQLIDYDESDAEEELLQAQMEAQEHVHDVHFSKWLTATQCAFSPVFCVSVLFASQKHVGWYILAAVLCGISVATLTAVFADNGKNPAGRLARCFIGFGVAMVWIMAIADEVVQVLQTFGHIFGLSDAIIGLTIFAIGNSLADFVANFTVAAFAPVMGVSACFGGPMLNMLLGIGLSGSYVISQTGESYKVNLSSTLLVSAVGLLCLLISTLVVVPFNNFNLTRRWGMTLIASYVVVMVVNVVVEVKKSS